jgi:hypothetical protein
MFAVLSAPAGTRRLGGHAILSRRAWPGPACRTHGFTLGLT